jgi:phosphoglycerate dehydrogenase-like enzyme
VTGPLRPHLDDALRFLGHFDSTLGVWGTGGIGKSTVLKLVREVSGRVMRFDLSTPVFMVPEAARGEAQGD